PTALDLFLLQNAQQRYLNLGTKFRDLIKKDRPAVSSFESPNALLHSAREGAFLMTEQFAGDQFLRQSSAIHFDQGSICTWRAAMNRVRHQLFSGSGLAGN